MTRHTWPLVKGVTLASFLFAASNVSASSPTAYVSVCCNAPSTVSVFNASTLGQTRSIATGSGGDGLALSPDGTKIFVTTDNPPELQAISTATGAVLATVPVPIAVSGTPPVELAINPNGSTVYVFAPQDVPNSLLLAVNARTYQVTATLSLPFNESLGPLLVSPDGTQIYFEVGLVNQYIQVIDAATLKAVKQIPVDESPGGLAITPSGLLLMTDTVNELLVIDPKAGAIVNRFSLSNSTQILTAAVISSPDSSTAYISFGGSSILAVNIATGATVFNAPTGYAPTQFAISAGGQKLYSINQSRTGTLSVSEFDIPTQKPVATSRQLGPLKSLALSPNGGSLFVLNASVSAIVPVDVASQQPGTATLGGVGINSLAIPPNGTAVWASAYAFAPSGDILVLNPATGRLGFINGPGGGLSFAPGGTVLYAANPGTLVALDIQSGHIIGKFLAGNLQNIGQALPSPDGKSLFVSITFVSGNPPGRVVLPQGEIVVLDAASLKPVSVISVSGGLGVIALTPDGSNLVCTSNDGRVLVINAATGTVTATIKLVPATGVLEGLALSNDGSTAFITDALNNVVFEANLSTFTQQAKISVGMTPLAVAVTPDNSEAWVATAAGLDIVTVASGHVSGPVPLPGTPSAIVFAP